MSKMKFALQTTKGQTVYRVAIGIRAALSMSNATTQYPHGIQVQKLKIVHQTKYKIALSDDWLTLLDRIQEGRKKESYHRCLESCEVSIVTRESYFPNGIFAHIYTTGDPQKAIGKMRTAIKKKVHHEYSFLQDMNVDSIIDGMVESFVPAP